MKYQLRDLFITCSKCKQYHPFYWLRVETSVCYDCIPGTTPQISRILNSYYVKNCDPELTEAFNMCIKLKENIYKGKPTTKVADNIRNRIGKLIRKKSIIKPAHTIKLLGCTWREFELYIESKFEDGMNWGNYGNKDNNWSIDHVIPLSALNLFDKTQFMKANHYTNLQPMWHKQNLSKGSKLVWNN